MVPGLDSFWWDYRKCCCLCYQMTWRFFPAGWLCAGLHPLWAVGHWWPPMVTAAPVVTAWSPCLLQPKHSPIGSITSGDQPAANLCFLCKCAYAEVSVKLGLISGALLSTSWPGVDLEMSTPTHVHSHVLEFHGRYQQEHVGLNLSVLFLVSCLSDWSSAVPEVRTW